MMQQGSRQLTQQVGIIDTDDRMTSDSRASRAVAQKAVGSREVAAPTNGANTPSGMLRADSVPATHCTGVGSARVTRRVFGIGLTGTTAKLSVIRTTNYVIALETAPQPSSEN
jgi:hypothetical protein